MSPTNFPDSPEAVALALLDRVLERGEPHPRGSNRSAERRVIDLYVQCLAAVRSDPAANEAAYMN